MLVQISEKENERMMNIIEEMDALKVLTQTLVFNNELYKENSELYDRIKNDLKDTMSTYHIAWQEIIKKYQLNPEKADKYVLNFNDRSIHCIENK